MKKNRPCFLIMAGDGINCERETMNAFKLAGADAEIVHINDLLKNKNRLNQYDGMAIPGGFSFGDELGSGQILALKIRHGLKNEIKEFVKAPKPIIGICNGFQVLVKLGLLPKKEKRCMSLAPNHSRTFINKWVDLEVIKNSKCIWTNKLKSELEFSLPIRHGEGRVVFEKESEKNIYLDLIENGQVALKYKKDINGSYQNIAGVCDETGLIFGLMPHPEAYVSNLTHNNLKNRKEKLNKGLGLIIFESAVEYLKRGNL